MNSNRITKEHALYDGAEELIRTTTGVRNGATLRSAGADAALSQSRRCTPLTAPPYSWQRAV